jgi:hypothetical protein
MAKVRKFNGGGMKSNWEGSNQVSPGHPSQSYNPTKNPATKSHWSGNGGNGGKSGNGTTKTTTTGNGTKTTVKPDKPRFVPSLAYNVLLGVQKLADKHNLKKRTKFARDEGLFRDYHIANRYNKDPKSRTLDVMSKTGKDFLKEAGYGPFQDKRETGEGENKEHLKCPDGTAAPCPPQATSTPAVTPASTTPQSTWKLYPEGSDYITGQGYDTGGGVRKGPPPKRGPNPQVPPLLFSRGGGAAVKGTKFKGVK